MSDNKLTPPTHNDPHSVTTETWEQHGVLVGLNAVIVSVLDETPFILVMEPPDTDPTKQRQLQGLPFGLFDPETHRTMEMGLRTWVEAQTNLALGYVEQLYTFGDRGRDDMGTPEDSRIISVGYLALTLQGSTSAAPGNEWHNWYRYFPWEDWRDTEPSILDKQIEPALRQWAESTDKPALQSQRWDRACLCFGFNDRPWDEEKVLERYELLYEAGLVAEAFHDRGREPADTLQLGKAMMSDHRRILATGMSRLRGKLKYRPVVFELMSDSFTLLQLQRTVEAISGIRLHKQNFRRLVEKEGLVEGTGQVSTRTGGRPAEEFRFRREILTERPSPGLRVRTPKRP